MAARLVTTILKTRTSRRVISVNSKWVDRKIDFRRIPNPRTRSQKCPHTDKAAALFHFWNRQAGIEYQEKFPLWQYQRTSCLCVQQSFCSICCFVAVSIIKELKTFSKSSPNFLQDVILFYSICLSPIQTKHFSQPVPECLSVHIVERRHAKKSLSFFLVVTFILLFPSTDNAWRQRSSFGTFVETMRFFVGEAHLMH